MVRKKRITALVIEAGRQPRAVVINDADSCREFLELIGCDSLDFKDRKIGGKAYCLAVDDSFLTKDGLPCSGVCGLRERLVGKIVVTGPGDANGSLKGLSDRDIAIILKNTISGVLCYDL